MKQRLSALLLALVTALSLAMPAFATPAPRHVSLSPQSLSVNGVRWNVQKYNIDDYNYFKLRDIALLVSGTGSQFSVGWEPGAGIVSIVTGEPYVPQGGELAVGEDLSASAVPSAQTLQINGYARNDLYVYNIGGENYFKLRDLGKAIGFDVDFDAATNTAIVRTYDTPQPQPQPQPQPTPEPEPTPAPAREAQLTVGSQTYHAGMSAEELIALAGAPAERLSSTRGFTWYVYGTTDYLDFFLAGVCAGKVATLVSGGRAFSWMGAGAGARDLSPVPGVTFYTDKNDNGILHAIELSDSSLLPASRSTDADALRGEARVNFHITNAFRVYHGLPVLLWDDAAAEAARLHSEDMAQNNYFDHTSRDGRTPWQRMEAQGVRYSKAAENIAAGYTDGVDAYNGWVNSSGHRANMLGSCTRLGVGFAYSSASEYLYYATQDYFTPQG